MKKFGGITAIVLSLCAAVAVIFLIAQRIKEDASLAAEGETPLEEEETSETVPVFETPKLASEKFDPAGEKEDPVSEKESEEEERTEEERTEEDGTEEGSEEAIPDGQTPEPADQFLLCIDPGHYGGANPVNGNGSYGYAEGDVTLRLANRLQEILWDTYGIDSYLTRESEHITIGGLSDKALDTQSIYLRGAYASLYQCDLFLSLHTNANAANANGYPTFDQPPSINKPMIILNETAVSSEMARKTAFAVGKELAEIYRAHDLPGAEFDDATLDAVPEWTGKYNDGLGFPGRVVKRRGKAKEGSDDYYGVLRGSANEGIPGMIIEHGFHSVKEIRRLAMEEDLIEEWAMADARGIASGLGLSDY